MRRTYDMHLKIKTKSSHFCKQKSTLDYNFFNDASLVNILLILILIVFITVVDTSKTILLEFNKTNYLYPYTEY